jgi:hypothetical protein
MSEPTTPVPGVPEGPQSFPSRFMGVFFSPGETFASIARRPDFIAPLIVLMAGTIAVTETIIAKIGMERILRMALEQRGQANIPPEAFQRALQIQSIIMHVVGVVSLPIILLIIAAVGLLIVNALFGAKVSFKQAFSATCYANLVGFLGALMALALILFGDPEHFNLQNFIPTNPGYFMNPLETSKPMAAVAGSLDIFTFWVMALLSIGFSEATMRKVRARTLFFIFFGLWAVWVLGKVGLAAIF